MALNKDRIKIACQVDPETYKWIKDETKRRGLAGEGYLIDDLVKRFREEKK